MEYKSNLILYSYAIQSFSQNEIINMIPKDVYAEIKAKDEHPFFQVYSICHDGDSQPKLLDSVQEGKIHWTKKAIQSIKNVIKKGIKFFAGHNADNSISNRRSLGEVVGYQEKVIDGKLHSVVVGYFPSSVKEEVQNYDVCSQEAVWNFIKIAGKSIATTIEELTGIALGNSSVEQPAFAGAKRLGMIQAFGLGNDPENKADGESAKQKEVKIMTLNDVRNYIRENAVHPAQLGFSIEDIKKDRELGKVFDEMENFKKENEVYKKEKLELETKIKNVEAEKQKLTANERFQNLLKGYTLTEKEKLFIEEEFKDNRILDLNDNNIKIFIDEQRPRYKKYASVFSKEQNINTLPANNNLSSEYDPTKKDSNPMLSEDLNLEE